MGFFLSGSFISFCCLREEIFFSAIQGDSCGTVPRRHVPVPTCAYGGACRGLHFAARPSVSCLVTFRLPPVESGDVAMPTVVGSRSFPSVVQVSSSSLHVPLLVTTTSLNARAPALLADVSRRCCSCPVDGPLPSKRSFAASTCATSQSLCFGSKRSLTGSCSWHSTHWRSPCARLVRKLLVLTLPSRSQERTGQHYFSLDNAKVHSDTKLKIDAVARSHGEPVSMLCADLGALVLTFNFQIRGSSSRYRSACAEIV